MVAGLCPPTPQGVADAYDHASQALAFADWLDDAACHATALLQLGHVAARCGEAPIAINCFEAAILNIERVKDRAYLVTHTRAQAHHALAKLTLQCAVVADTAPERRMLLERAREHAATALQHAHRFRDHRAVQRANLWCGDVLFQVLAQGDAPPREHLLLRLREMKRHLRGLNTAPSEVAARAMCLAQLAGLRGRDRLAWRILQTAARDPTPLEHDGVAARWLELAVRYFPVRDDPERYRGIVAAQAAARRRAASAYAHVSAQVQSKRIELERNRADQFLAHDLRSPLSSAVAALNEALSTQDGRALRPAIDLACAKLDRALQTIDSAALFTRLGEHEVLSAGTVSLLELAHEALCDVEPLAHRRGVVIRIARAEAAFTVGKRAALHRALVNLLNNAVQHSPTGGEVRVTLESGQGRHRVRIKDSGPGLHIDDRLARSLEHVSAGEMHGLGLASARRIVRSHFGRLVLRNDPGGVGAVAEVTLPATEPTALPHHQ
jgi:signal transduction histidine kinase